jgi:adenylate kinase
MCLIEANFLSAVHDQMELGQARDRIEDFAHGLTKSIDCLDSLNPGSIHIPAQILEPGPLLLLGAPGVGKGTQADSLAKLWGVPKVSTGDILRANVADGTTHGLRAKRIMERGGLVPDEIMTEMVVDRLGRTDTALGFILDGFPRTIPQAMWLDGYLSEHRQRDVLGIVHLCMDFDGIVERIVHRRVCPFCKTLYNIQLKPPKRTGRCDKDDTELIQRSDDGLDVLQTRLDVFKRETEPLLQYYRCRSPFVQIEADESPSIVTEAIVAALTRYRTHAN